MPRAGSGSPGLSWNEPWSGAGKGEAGPERAVGAQVPLLGTPRLPSIVPLVLLKVYKWQRRKGSQNVREQQGFQKT